jgi:hypothetical protein
MRDLRRQTPGALTKMRRPPNGERAASAAQRPLSGLGKPGITGRAALLPGNAVYGEARKPWQGHLLSGAATLVLGPDIVNRQRRPATMRTVVEFNGPGNNGSEVRDGIAYEIKSGDVVVIPAGTGHWFTRIEDHIDYIMVRIDPDKVTPLKSEAQSQDYLSKPARRGE